MPSAGVWAVWAAAVAAHSEGQAASPDRRRPQIHVRCEQLGIVSRDAYPVSRRRTAAACTLAPSLADAPTRFDRAEATRRDGDAAALLRRCDRHHRDGHGLRERARRHHLLVRDPPGRGTRQVLPEAWSSRSITSIWTGRRSSRCSNGQIGDHFSVRSRIAFSDEEQRDRRAGVEAGALPARPAVPLAAGRAARATGLHHQQPSRPCGGGGVQRSCPTTTCR